MPLPGRNSFLKFVAAHPAVTVITPATSRPVNMLDNLMGGRGALPDAAALQRMAEYVERIAFSLT